MIEIAYALEPGLDVSEFKSLLVSSGLGSQRPIDDEDRLRIMLANASLILTARSQESGRLVGVVRGVGDAAWCCYVSELAVCGAFKGQGVGRRLLSEARRRLGPEVSLILISVPEAVSFYERVGMARVPDAFWCKRES